MKIERPRLQKLLERSLETGDAAPLKAALQETTAAEVESFLSSVDAGKRRDIEKLLGAPVSSIGTSPLTGKSVVDVRAQKQNPWWKAVQAQPLPALIHPEPLRDVDVHGERFTKDDVASMLRSIGR
jgi:hypothetical protein